jgi:ABC-type dipeptide/oligopeptide/nickel transport system ATPase component
MKNHVSKIYENREEFIVIGLTGKTGSGCTTVAKILEDGYKDYNEINSKDKHIQNRKDSIIKTFASKAFKKKKFKVIKPSTLMMMLFVFEKQILFGKIRPLKELLDKTNDEIKKLYEGDINKFQDSFQKELVSLKELYRIIINFNKLQELEGFENNFNEKKDYTDKKNRKLLSNYIDNKKQDYEKKLLQQDKTKFIRRNK